jgi:hypothetical protein
MHTAEPLVPAEPSPFEFEIAIEEQKIQKLPSTMF